ncbi:hypothetical protein G5C51_24995 [Streptomyces sp. A7024]|uniref:Uncharacterized protein n=1 Tax=Streptomyces coryli TaxID=1128680 RepID=A0A6G4U570_9ACTN|nr:hypothetical protein [Streptomyces coryli]NGN67152.1 hypothetical protein [Streptomyces coryli]
MTGRGDPPEGTPDGVPGGGEEEFRSVVFDESFVNAARLEEYSAQERMGDHAPAVRRRRNSVSGVSKQALVLVLLIAVAFGTAIYMGVRHPYQQPPARADADPLHAAVVPLTPSGPVPGGSTEALFDHSPAVHFRTGAAGVILPSGRGTAHFSRDQVAAALNMAKEYVLNSAITPRTLTGGDTRAVRLQLDPDLLAQFDRSVDRPVADGEHAATGWMVRFNPARVALADRKVRVDGTVTYSEANAQELEVVADHTFVYALRPAGSAAAEAERKPASLFTAHRVVRMRFDRDNLRQHQLRPVETSLAAGPLGCSADPSGYLQPLLAGEKDRGLGRAGTDPYARAGDRQGNLCGVLSPSSQPSP